MEENLFMRVMQIVKKLKHGGGETVALRLMEGAENNPQAVVAAPGEWSDRFPGEHFEMGETSLKPQDLVRAARRICAAVRQFRPDVVHAHSPGTTAATALALIGLRGIRFVSTSHGGEPPEKLKKLAVMYRLTGAEVISCGPGVTEVLREGGLEPVATINNGIAPSSVDSESPRDLAAEFGLDPQQKVLAVVGRLDPVKNQQQLLEAVARYPHVGVLVCGDGVERERLEALTDQLDLRGRVKFLGMRRDVPEIMHWADAVVLASRVEGLPVTLLEAMGEGTPVIATRVLGTEQLIEDGRNGLLVELDDVQGLADAIRRVDTEDGLPEALAEGGLATVRNYTLESMTRRYWDYYASASR